MAMATLKQSKSYKRNTPAGHEYTVTRMDVEDVEQELVEFERRYGMSSEEFARKWRRGEMDCGVMDYFDWATDCYFAYLQGRAELDIGR